MSNRFRDRSDAGRQLAETLSHLQGQNVLVLGLPRGGLPVAYEVAHRLHAPLDVLNVRKLGVPWHAELAMGAIATGGVRVVNDAVVETTGVTRAELEAVAAAEQRELDRRERVYRGGRPAPDIRGRTIIIVDDGIATGATVRAAIAVVRAQNPSRLILAVPVAQASVVQELQHEVDELAYVLAPAELYAIGLWYDAFPQLADRDVQTILSRASKEVATA
jgi:putative phosphoribosyl transferase